MAGFLAYGSSTAQGFGDTQAGGGWPARLQQELRKFDEPHMHEVINHGFRFTLIHDILEYMPQDVERFHRPRRRAERPPLRLFGMFQLGSESSIEDRVTGREFVPPDQFKQKLQQLGTFCTKHLDGPPLLVTMPPLPKDADPTQGVGLNAVGCSKYNQHVRDFAQQSGALLADVEPVFDAHLHKYPEIDLYAPDRIHPNLTGHVLITNAVLPVALEMLCKYPATFDDSF